MKIKLDLISIFVISIIVGLFSTYYFNEFLTKVVAIEPKKSKYTLMEEEKIKYLQNLGINPYNQYGTTYQIGSFANTPVMLDERFSGKLYPNDILDKNGNTIRIKDLPENFNRPIYEIWFNFRYTDNAFLVRYKTASRDIVKQYDYESNNNPNHHWVTVGFAYDELLKDKKNYNDIADSIVDKKNFTKYGYMDYYIFNGKVYELEHYIINPETKYLKQRNYDIYLYRNSNNDITDIIQCTNYEQEKARVCILKSRYSFNGYISVRIDFQRNNLRDWKKIKQKTIDSLQEIVLNKKQSKK